MEIRRLAALAIAVAACVALLPTMALAKPTGPFDGVREIRTTTSSAGAVTTVPRSGIDVVTGDDPAEDNRVPAEQTTPTEKAGTDERTAEQPSSVRLLQSLGILVFVFIGMGGDMLLVWVLAGRATSAGEPDPDDASSP